jgi:hypothetical protein
MSNQKLSNPGLGVSRTKTQVSKSIDP